MSMLQTNVVLTNQGDDVAAEQTFGAAAPAQFVPQNINFASNQAIRRQVQEEIGTLMMMVRNSRSELEQEWLHSLRMHKLVHDGNQKYRGRSNAYLPIWARIESTQVAALTRGVFPSDDYFGVSDALSENPANAIPTQRWLQWELEENANLRSRFKPFARSFFRYGSAPMKVFYENTPVKQQKTRGGIVKLRDSYVNKMVPDDNCIGARVSPRSIFSWYAYPAHAQSLDECTLVFEDIDVPKAFLGEMLRLGYWLDADGAGIGNLLNGYRTAVMRSAMSRGTADLIEPSSTSSPQGQMATVTEAYTMMVLPAAGYTQDEDQNMPVSTKITMLGDYVVEVRRNPFWHQRPPYVLGRHDQDTGSIYGGGLGRLIAPLQYLCNDFANQTNDVGSYVLNPAWKVVRGMMAGPMLPMAPGRVWGVNDPDAITPVQMDVGLVPAAQSMLNLWTTMAQDWSGAPALAMGIGGSKSGKTATQSQILQQNMGMANQDVVEDIERDTLVPLLYMTWVNGQQFLPESVMATVAGQSIRVSRNDLAINPRFRWLGSSQAVSRAQRTQQLINLLQSVAPLLPVINASGYKVDLVSLIQRVWTDGLGLRGFSDFIRPLSPQEQMMQQQQAAMMQQGMQNPNAMPGGPAQIPGQDGDRVRSALEQVTGQEAAPEMAAGEGEHFMDARAQADEMAAMMGATRGGA